MKLSWTFYPKGENESITLSVIYVPALDKHDLKGGGFLAPEINTAYVNWDTYRRFDTGSLENRRDAFAGLVRLSKGGGLRIGNERIDWPIN